MRSPDISGRTRPFPLRTSAGSCGSAIADRPLRAHDRFDRRFRFGQCRELADRNRLHRRTQAVVADLLRRLAALRGDELRHRESAKAALTRAHSTAQEDLHLVRTGTAERDGIRDFARGDFLAAANDGVAARLSERGGGTIEDIEKRAAPKRTVELA